ncbi:hypothetical protein O181_011868 [Austropuccinia psidii MF-1]|uniref:Uncharacterized protein n=1 Tax=Austropuccinia psidii MF-1 TaxID=1389203 RepID=A0A9Q3BW38_9BASI|nr:hypothetical protein [Austropuccinia psidii MF-1]
MGTTGEFSIPPLFSNTQGHSSPSKPDCASPAMSTFGYSHCTLQIVMPQLQEGGELEGLFNVAINQTTPPVRPIHSLWDIPIPFPTMYSGRAAGFPLFK